MDDCCFCGMCGGISDVSDCYGGDKFGCGVGGAGVVVVIAVMVLMFILVVVVDSVLVLVSWG